MRSPSAASSEARTSLPAKGTWATGDPLEMIHCSEVATSAIRSQKGLIRLEEKDLSASVAAACSSPIDQAITSLCVYSHGQYSSPKWMLWQQPAGIRGTE